MDKKERREANDGLEDLACLRYDEKRRLLDLMMKTQERENEQRTASKAGAKVRTIESRLPPPLQSPRCK